MPNSESIALFREKLKKERRDYISMAHVTELSAVSDQSFEDAINQAINRATKTLCNVEGAWVEDIHVLV